VELGYDQAPRLREKHGARARSLRFHRDLAGHERVLEWTGAGG
jgi:hypothetical protein